MEDGWRDGQEGFLLSPSGLFPLERTSRDVGSRGVWLYGWRMDRRSVRCPRHGDTPVVYRSDRGRAVHEPVLRAKRWNGYEYC